MTTTRNLTAALIETLSAGDVIEFRHAGRQWSLSVTVIQVASYPKYPILSQITVQYSSGRKKILPASYGDWEISIVYRKAA